MKKIVLSDIDETKVIHLSQVDQSKPIFAKRDGKLAGMVILESSHGWILRTGGRSGCTGHHNTLAECLKSAIKCQFEFFVEEK